MDKCQHIKLSAWQLWRSDNKPYICPACNRRCSICSTEWKKSMRICHCISSIMTFFIFLVGAQTIPIISGFKYASTCFIAVLGISYQLLHYMCFKHFLYKGLVVVHHSDTADDAD